MLVGFIAGSISAFGFGKITPFLRNRIGLHDTCGVIYLHCIPGVIGAVVSSIVSALADKSFGLNYGQTFIEPGRTPGQQAGIQLAGEAVTIGISIIGGVIGGLISSRRWFLPPKELFEDMEHWHDKEILENY
jgi:ammonium transporter Rh